MGGKRTRDGISIKNILKSARLAGAEIREGKNHPYMITLRNSRPCPLATSTDARRMVVPYIAQTTGRSTSEVYRCLREGIW